MNGKVGKEEVGKEGKGKGRKALEWRNRGEGGSLVIKRKEK
jgi:hypothetical protein